MSQTIDVNGQSINYPETGDTNWGDEATEFAVQTSAALGKLGLASGTSVDIAQTLDVTGNTTLDANLSVTGNATITGILNVDSGVLYVDPTNNRVGINDATPSVELDVNGAVAITGNTTVGGTLGISNGTASAPSLTPSGDTNTGLYSIGSDVIGFSANGIRQGEFGVGYGGFTGNIIQVVSGELTTRATTFSATFVDTGLSATITPKYSTSKILVIFNSGAATGNAGVGMFFNIVRGSTNIAQSTGGTGGNQTGWHYNNSDVSPSPISASILDSPNTTSATTYKIQFRSSSQGSTVAINGRASANDFPAYGSILLMELQQ